MTARIGNEKRAVGRIWKADRTVAAPSMTIAVSLWCEVVNFGHVLENETYACVDKGIRWLIKKCKLCGTVNFLPRPAGELPVIQ